MRSGMTEKSPIVSRFAAFQRTSSRGRLDLKELVGQRPFVLLFLPEGAEETCAAYVREYAENEAHYHGLGARVIVVTAAKRVDLPVEVVSGARALFRERGMVDGEGRPQAGVVIVDRYGEIASVDRAATCSELPSQDLVARRLMGVEAECPECGVAEPHWQEAAEKTGE